ncbi:hypothetical protein BH11PLA2_BH11PLA2_14250 [soil metagenome]
MSNAPVVADLTSEEFLQNLTGSGLSGVEEARVFVAEASDATGSRIANRLVDNGTLTMFQANAILQGMQSALRVGNYDILDKLGAGGMGAVYKARHRRMKRIVALKVLSNSVAQSATFTQRFQREVEVIAKLQHPNVVMAFDADECDDGPFLIMEFVDGRDLAGEVNDDGPLSVADAANCILHAARGLECAHSQGIVHRDIKPSNLMRDKSGAVKVADLGLARLNGPEGVAAADFSLTQAGSVLGTVDYMAPEQALDSTTVDARADIYSLGATVYFLLAGKPLYQAGSIMAVLLKHRDAPIPSLCESRSDVPVPLEAIYRRMVAKNPQDRFASMTEVIAALEAASRATVFSDQRPGKGSPAETPATDQTTVLPITPFTETSTVKPVAGSKVGPKEGPTVVLVEPSRAQAGIIRRYLEQLGMVTVHLAKSGHEALELARREQQAIIISALHLSDMTGVQLAQAMLADPACQKIKFVLATSTSETDASALQLVGPRVSLMPKPFDADRLKHAIESVAGV